MARKHPNASQSQKPEESPAAAEEKERLDELLDEALEETFPASDPIAVTPKREDEESEGRG